MYVTKREERGREREFKIQLYPVGREQSVGPAIIVPTLIPRPRGPPDIRHIVLPFVLNDVQIFTSPASVCIYIHVHSAVVLHTKYIAACSYNEFYSQTDI